MFLLHPNLLHDTLVIVWEHKEYHRDCNGMFVVCLWKYTLFEDIPVIKGTHFINSYSCKSAGSVCLSIKSARAGGLSKVI